MEKRLAKFPVALIAALAGIGVAIVISTCALRLNAIMHTSVAMMEPMFGSESIHMTVLLVANLLGALTAGYVSALLLPDARLRIAVTSAILFCVWAAIEFLLPPAAFLSLGWLTVLGAVPAAIAGTYLLSKQRNVA